jgi:hypothetical protein
MFWPRMFLPRNQLNRIYLECFYLESFYLKNKINLLNCSHMTNLSLFCPVEIPQLGFHWIYFAIACLPPPAVFWYIILFWAAFINFSKLLSFFYLFSNSEFCTSFTSRVRLEIPSNSGQFTNFSNFLPGNPH